LFGPDHDTLVIGLLGINPCPRTGHQVHAAQGVAVWQQHLFHVQPLEWGDFFVDHFIG